MNAPHHPAITGRYTSAVKAPSVIAGYKTGPILQKSNPRVTSRKAGGITTSNHERNEIMTVQQLRGVITAALMQFFPDIPVYVEGDKPQSAYFRLELLTATYDRQREGRYMAVYRFGIRYKQGSLLDAEAMADGLCEALDAGERVNPAYRVVRQSWVAGGEGQGALFTVDYMLYLQKQKLPEGEAELMGHFTEGARLK